MELCNGVVRRRETENRDAYRAIKAIIKLTNAVLGEIGTSSPMFAESVKN